MMPIIYEPLTETYMLTGPMSYSVVFEMGGRYCRVSSEEEYPSVYHLDEKLFTFNAKVVLPKEFT